MGDISTAARTITTALPDYIVRATPCNRRYSRVYKHHFKFFGSSASFMGIVPCGSASSTKIRLFNNYPAALKFSEKRWRVETRFGRQHSGAADFSARQFLSGN